MSRTRIPCAWALALWMVACTSDAGRGEARLSVRETLAGSDTAGYERAVETRALVLPGDHGPHSGFRTEWWYVTGNLTSDAGRDFGFQLTIFRSALSPRPPESTSAWATNQAYMGHFALTDVERDGFHAFERFARGAAGLAGASADPLRVWVDGWRLEGGVTDLFPLRVRAAEGDVSLDLTLSAGKPLVLQGVDGLSRKGPEAGNASYYYSLTRLPAEGRLTVGGDTLAVSGLGWLDREWSTSALGEGQVGWDWLALQLDDGWDVMVYTLRRRDGSADRFGDGIVVAPDGRSERLALGTDVTVAPTSTWTSPIDGAEYPSGWTVALPARGWRLTVEPVVRAQELDLAFRYWEGAVRVSGTGEGGAAVTGRGYVELTGYAGEAPGR